MLNKMYVFNDNWQFAKSDLETTTTRNLNFHPVEIPHDWLIYDTENLYEHSIGWYKKEYKYDPSSEKDIVITFEGVYMDSVLFVNDQKVGEWKYGYSKFEFNISEFLNSGTNQLLLKVTYQSPNSRWYTGAGIYRDVWLKERSKNYIETDGVYVSTFKENENWRVEVDTSLSVTEPLELRHALLKNGTVVADVTTDVKSDQMISQTNFQINDPRIWDIQKPDLYELTTTLRLKLDNEIIESQTQKIGFKQIEFDTDRGFFLNGQHLKLYGVNEHHDLGALGAAFNVNALRRRMKILKDMGVNAIRTAHNMPAKEMMTLADEMGFLVVTEAFDMWERSKTRYDYARFFKEWHKKDIESWVKRDRNHVSLIMWSIGNEIYDTHADERGQQLTEILTELVYQFDPKKNAVVTIGSNYMPWENAQACADIVKMAGYNYGEKYYEQHHKEHPDWVIYGSETVAVVQSRGVYHFPYDKPILADDDQHCSSLGNSATSWGAKSIETALIKERDTPFSLGQFIWTGFDYIGEPTPYHTKNAYFGSIDTATFKKDSYYVYQSAWTNYKESPMVHIFPYWDFNEGQMIDVRVATNAPKVDLLLNGQSLGIQEIDHNHGDVISGWWKVPYQKGTLEAYAYDLEGNIIAQDQKQSFEDPADITLATADTSLQADGIDLAFIEIGMIDKNGKAVENANNRVNVEVEGAGRLVGLDNGDQTDYDQYKGTSRRLFNGKLMAIISSTFETGPIHIKVNSPTLPEASLILTANKPKIELPNKTPIAANQSTAIITGQQNEIPVRKIEIGSDQGQILTAKQPTANVTANLCPKNTDYQEVKWSVVNDVGIESNIASITAHGLDATVSAFGDGDFRVRCTSRNGKDTINLISELEFKAEGLGTAFKDPYSFISAGLYDQHKGELTNGNERGVATSRDGESQVGFRDIDFGKDGSDTVTIPIFALTSEPYEVQIWEGMPGEPSSILLADAIYQKESKWNVYQEETFTLSKKLKGITSLSFVTNKKMHIKGFRFEKQNRAFEQNYAVNADKIYGDDFTKLENRVEQIGNNVSFEFDDFDFGEQGASELVLYGHSPIDRNSIHIRFFDGVDERAEILEFEYSEDYQEKRFHFNRVKGVQKISIIFLPGSNFNFNWFQFKS
ncbi:glycoside hydrolase family 2 TIM barrel-domain containing protein [Gracilibacillus massiliensis]|uniref:glycoside hydrolase family 2 TIM barrel-domain containing protein n=1 Tax=Gracilibacillus massiliensis TaxID=1564956 RepID=UPI00071D2198|nr:glycoside hydrolase family 2 TIM barrel-domain containing protein [Gracilibacillus massiliensis]